jgi:threonine/homoserine/homoserine lactone efflux protein
MPDAAALTLFLVSAVILCVTPGPAVLYIAARSIDQGRAAGLVSVAGIAVGTLFHIAAAAFGLSAILMRSATAFNLVKWLGAAYLIWLGIQRFRAQVTDESTTVTPEPLSRIFRNGIAVNVLNPKTAIFFFAFLPQFVQPGHANPAAQIVLLGLLFMVVAIASDAMYALAAGSAGRWLRGNRAFARKRNYVTGAVYVGLGVMAAVAGNRK